MKTKLLFISLLLFSSLHLFSTEGTPLYGTKVRFDIQIFNGELASKKSQQETIVLPNATGKDVKFNLTRNNLGSSGLVTTYDGLSVDGSIVLKLSVMEDRIVAAMADNSGYWFLEPENVAENVYRLYNLSEIPSETLQCGVDGFEDHTLKKALKQLQEVQTEVSNFSIGDNYRVFRLAVAGTGEGTKLYASKSVFIASIETVVNLANLIYERELAISFTLIDKTRNGDIVFAEPMTDPFAPNANGASAQESQNGFTYMANQNILPYSYYDIGHTFHVLAGSNLFIRGQAGASLCNNASKARGWTEWVKGVSYGALTAVFVHESAHQFSAQHTYNAGGGVVGSPTFCEQGWSAVSAVEPGGGSTMMAYGTNCQQPQQTLTGDVRLRYFHAKSIEVIDNHINNIANCFTLKPTGNTPPTANAGVDVTIPKGTPFWLQGTASDSDDKSLTYTWEQCNPAAYEDMGALGSIQGQGGVAAVNSITAPLFRSEQSLTADRYFPKMQFVLNNKNIPPNLYGEALPEVSRKMNFRFTARDARGGIAIDEVRVNVSDVGPLQVVSPNGGENLAANSLHTITWAVNSTDELSPNVRILLSTDGGMTFPYVLAENMINDGSEAITIPNVPQSSHSRIKIVATLNDNACFFDASDDDFEISNNCSSYNSVPCFPPDFVATLGSDSLNLSLSDGMPSTIIENIMPVISLDHFSAHLANPSDDEQGCRSIQGYYTTDTIHFRVSETGQYTFTNIRGDYLNMMVFNDRKTLTCQSYLGSSAYIVNTLFFNNRPTLVLNLQKCTDYYMVASNFLVKASNPTDAVTINIKGTGKVYQVPRLPTNVSYTYIAVNVADNLIKQVSDIGDFRMLTEGNYIIYGVAYPSALSANVFVGKTIPDIQNNDCAVIGGTSLKIKVGNLSGITESPLESVENPFYLSASTDDLYIKNGYVINKLEIFDLKGQKQMSIIRPMDKISLRKLNNGIYIVKTIDAKSTIISKILKH